MRTNKCLRSLLNFHRDLMTGKLHASNQKSIESRIYSEIERTFPVGSKVKTKRHGIGKVRRVKDFGVLLELPNQDICTWFGVGDLVK